MLGRQQGAIGRRALLWLRNRKLPLLKQLQDIFQLLRRQLAEGRLPILLTDIVADGLAIIALIQQFSQLRQRLARAELLFGSTNTLIQILLGGRKVARQQRRVVFQPQIVFYARPNLSILLRGHRD